MLAKLVRADLGLSGSGASRARTGDLLGATQTLSQLSYSPELVLGRHGNSTTLSVSRRHEPEVHGSATIEMACRNEVTPIDVGTEETECIDLIGAVRGANVAGGG